MSDGGEANIIVAGLLAFNSKSVGGNMRRSGEGLVYHRKGDNQQDEMLGMPSREFPLG